MAGIWDMITGQNPNQGAINNAQNNANQATTAENQLIQGILPIYNTELSQFNQNYAPLMSGLGSEMQGLLGENSLGDVSQIMTLAGLDPSLRDALTGIPGQGLTNNILSYDSSPGETLSGIGGVGGTALSTYLNPNTNLASVTPGLESYFGNPENTNLAGVTPGAASFYGNEALNGLSPQSINAALNPYDVQSQQQINSIRNSLGDTLPNEAGTLEDLNLQNLQGRTGVLSSLAGENQLAQERGVQGLLGTAGGLDTQTAQMLSVLPSLSSGLDEQTMQRIAGAMQTAGGIDQMTQQMLDQAYGIGSQAEGLGMGYGGNSLTNEQSLLGDIQGFLSSGQGLLPGASGGLSSLAGLYGNAAGNAANQAFGLANSGAQQNAGMFGGLTGIFGTLAGAGAFPGLFPGI